MSQVPGYNYNLPPIPSLTNLTYQIYLFLANHPLIANPPIRNPITGEIVKIQRYRLYPGLSPGAGLTCSIWPYPGDGSGDAPNPRTTSVSAMYEPYDLGEHGTDHAVYHISIGFYYNEVTVGNLSTDLNLITVPDDAATTPEELLLTNSNTKTVNLEINPAIDIIANYLELTRLVISDWYHKQIFNIKVNSFEALYSNLGTSNNWEENSNVYFHQGVLMTRLDAYISRGWRDKFLNPLENINVNMRSPKTER